MPHPFLLPGHLPSRPTSPFCSSSLIVLQQFSACSSVLPQVVHILGQQTYLHTECGKSLGCNFRSSVHCRCGSRSDKRTDMTRTRTARCLPHNLNLVYRSGITTVLPGVVRLAPSVRFLGAPRSNPTCFDTSHSVLQPSTLDVTDSLQVVHMSPTTLYIPRSDETKIRPEQRFNISEGAAPSTYRRFLGVVSG